MADKPLTPAEVEKRYGYTPRQMRDYEEQGIVKAARTPGGHRRYDAGDIEHMFDKRSIPSATATPERLTRQEGYDEFGTTGLRQWGGSVYEERLRALRGREGRREYREMRRNDPVISAIFFAILNALKQASPRISPASEEDEDKEAAEFTESCLFDMSFTWLDTFTFMTEPQLEQGFSLVELIYKRRLGLNPPKYTEDPARSMFDDGRVGWRKMPPRPAETLAQGNEWVFDEAGGVQGIVQQPETSFEGAATTIFIPIQKLLHFRTTVHPANNPEGLPIHRAMYLPYYYSRNIAELEAIGVERDLAGLPVAYMGSDTKKQGANNDFDNLKTLVTNIRIDEQAGIVIPYAKMGNGATEGAGVLLELLAPERGGGGGKFNTSEILDRYDRLKAISVLAQFIMLGMNQTGSYALSKHQGDIFILAIGSFLANLENVFNRHAIPKLIALNNFPNITGFPELKFNTIGVPDLAAIADYVNKLVDKAVITPDMELERHLRQLADLPELEERPQAVIEPDQEPAEKIQKASMKPLKLTDADIDRLGDITDDDIALAQRFARDSLSPQFQNLLLATSDDLEEEG